MPGGVGKFALGTGLIVAGVALAPYTGGISLGLVSIGTSYVLGSLFPLEAENAGIQANVADNRGPVPVVYGTARVGIQYADVRVDTSNNKILYIVGVLCHESDNGEPIDDVAALYFNGRLAWNGTKQAPFDGTNEDSDPVLTYTEHLGKNTAVDSALNSAFATEWPTTSIGKGLAYLVLKLAYDKEVYLSGIPNVTAQVQGAELWDPRLGSNRATLANWAYSTNPALAMLDYLMATVYGYQVPQSEIDEPSFIAMANYFDELISVPDDLGGSENIKRFECNGSLNTGRSIEENLGLLESSCRGHLIYQGGKFRLVTTRVVTPTTFALTEDNTVAGSWEFATTGTSETPNLVRAAFINALNESQPDSRQWPRAGATNVGLTEDSGFLVERDIVLPFTQNHYTAEQIAMVLSREGRDALRVTVTAQEEALQLEPGDVVPVTRETPAWTAKNFWVVGVLLNTDATIQLALVEYQSTAYTIDAQTQYPTVPDSGLPDPWTVAAPTSLILTADDTTSLDNGDGTYTSRIKVAWTASVHGFVDKYEIEAKRSTDANYDWQGELDGPTRPIEFFIPGVNQGIQWNVRVRAISTFGKPSAWLSGNVTVGAPYVGPLDMTGFALTVNKLGIWQLNWNPVSSQTLRRYEIRKGGSNWATATFFAYTGATSLTLKPGDVSRTVTFRAKAEDHSGQMSTNAVSDGKSDLIPNAGAITAPDIDVSDFSGLNAVVYVDFSGSEARFATLYASLTSPVTVSAANARAIVVAPPGADLGSNETFQWSMPSDGSWFNRTIFFKIGLTDDLTIPLADGEQVTSEFQATGGVVYDPPSGPTAGNSIVNPDFQAGFGYWASDVPAKTSIETTAPLEGTKSLRLETDTGQAIEVYQDVQPSDDDTRVKADATKLYIRVNRGGFFVVGGNCKLSNANAVAKMGWQEFDSAKVSQGFVLGTVWPGDTTATIRYSAYAFADATGWIVFRLSVDTSATQYNAILDMLVGSLYNATVISQGVLNPNFEQDSEHWAAASTNATPDGEADMNYATPISGLASMRLTMKASGNVTLYNVGWRQGVNRSTVVPRWNTLSQGTPFVYRQNNLIRVSEGDIVTLTVTGKTSRASIDARCGIQTYKVAGGAPHFTDWPLDFAVAGVTTTQTLVGTYVVPLGTNYISAIGVLAAGAPGVTGDTFDIDRFDLDVNVSAGSVGKGGGGTGGTLTAFPAGTGASDGAGPLRLMKGYQPFYVQHGDVLAYSNNYQNLPKFRVTGGSYYEGASLWVASAYPPTVPGALAPLSAKRQSAIKRLISQSETGATVEALLFQPNATIARRTTTDTQATITTVGVGATQTLSATATDYPAVNNFFYADYDLTVTARSSNKGAVECHLTWGIEFQHDGGSWERVFTRVTSAYAEAPSSTVAQNEAGPRQVTAEGIDQSDGFRYVVDSFVIIGFNGSPGCDFSLDRIDIQWDDVTGGTNRYADATPDSETVLVEVWDADA